MSDQDQQNDTQKNLPKLGGIPRRNDGGNITSLFLMVAALAYAVFNAVIYYERSTPTSDPARLPRLMTGWANIGNCIVHVFLTIIILANEKNTSDFWESERKLGGIGGPVFLAVLNFAAGLTALQDWDMWFPTVWNILVILTGCLMPVVWSRFLAEGFTTWPHKIVFVWFAIYAMELTAFVSSATHLALTQ